MKTKVKRTDDQKRRKKARQNRLLKLRGESRPESPLMIPRGMMTRPVATRAAQRKRRRQKRGQATLQFVHNAAEKSVEIMFYGSIGGWWGDITAESIDRQLKEAGAVDEINVRINSGGGDVFEATAIYNIFRQHEAYVRFLVEGVAASAATFVPMSGDEVVMCDNAYWMIHAASMGVWGNAEDLRNALELLDRADQLIRLTYRKKTDLSDEELIEMMDHDNWMTAAEALDYGFIDAIDDESDATPHVTPQDQLQTLPADAMKQLDLAMVETQLSTLSASIGAGNPLAKPSRPLARAKQTKQQPEKPAKQENVSMNKKLRAKCVKAGMPEDYTDEQAQDWLAENLAKLTADGGGAGAGGDTTTATQPTIIKREDLGQLQVGLTDLGQRQGGLTEERLLELLDEREKQREEKLKQFRNEVDANLELAFGEEIPEGLQQQCYDSATIEDVRAKIKDVRSKQQEQVPALRVNLAPNQPQEQHVAAIRDAVLVRCLNAAKLTGAAAEKHLPEADRAKGWDEFINMRMIDLARECLMADGYTYQQLRKLSNENIAKAALGFGSNIYALRNAAGSAIHTTGSLGFITQDAINKTLLAGYTEARITWNIVFRQAESVADFKTIHRVKLSAAPNLPVWPDNEDPAKAKLSNEEETYAVEARAQEINFSWRLIVNDDMSAISRTPAILGRAAARTVNAVSWSKVTSNPTMSDGQTLFLETPAGNRKRQNLTTGAGAPSVSTVGTLKNLMRQMRGLNTPEGNESEDILNIMPRFIVGPSALETTILQLVRSIADPADNKSSAVHNPTTTLEPVFEPLLDANSTTAWYLFADPGEIDTVEVTFLQGQETPVTNEFVDERTMSRNYTIVQTFEAAPIDHRGMQKHAGA